MRLVSEDGASYCVKLLTASGTDIMSDLNVSSIDIKMSAGELTTITMATLRHTIDIDVDGENIHFKYEHPVCDECQHCLKYMGFAKCSLTDAEVDKKSWYCPKHTVLSPVNMEKVSNES